MANIGSLTATLGVDTRGLSRAERAFRSATSNMARSLKRVTIALTAMGAAATYAFVKVSGSFLEVATTTENLQLRMNALLGSVEEGAKAFNDMATFAGKVPFEYRDIMNTATALAGIMKGGREEINRWMPVLTDLAAASGLTLQETTSNFIKMYSAGAAAADMFRERGILAMLGFKAGVHYTAEETREMLMKAWKDPESKFRGLTKNLAETWTGTMSMLADAWFQFRDMVMKAGIYEDVKNELKRVLDYVNKLKEEGKLVEYAQAISRAFQNMLKIMKVVAKVIKPIAQAIIAPFIDLKKLSQEDFISTFSRGVVSGMKVIAYSGAAASDSLRGVVMMFQSLKALLVWLSMRQNQQAIKQLVQFEGGYEKNKEQVDALADSIMRQQKEVERLNASVTDLANRPLATVEVGKVFEDVEGQLATLEKQRKLMATLEQAQKKSTDATTEQKEEINKATTQMIYFVDGVKQTMELGEQTSGTFSKMKDEIEETPRALKEANEQLDEMKKKYDALQIQIRRMNAEIRQSAIGGAVSHTGGTTLPYGISEARGGIFPSFTHGGFLQHFQGGGIMSGYSSKDKYLAAFRGGEAFISPERVAQAGRDTVQSIIDGTFRKPAERIVWDIRTDRGTYDVVVEKSDTFKMLLEDLRMEELMSGM